MIFTLIIDVDGKVDCRAFDMGLGHSTTLGRGASFARGHALAGRTYFASASSRSCVGRTKEESPYDDMVSSLPFPHEPDVENTKL